MQHSKAQHAHTVITARVTGCVVMSTADLSSFFRPAGTMQNSMRTLSLTAMQHHNLI
jgi:hypothetical protein